MIFVLILISSALSFHNNYSGFLKTPDHKSDYYMRYKTMKNEKPSTMWGDGYGSYNYQVKQVRPQKSVFQCPEKEEVCGTNGITYRNRCYCPVPISYSGRCNGFHDKRPSSFRHRRPRANRVYPEQRFEYRSENSFPTPEMYYY